MIETLETKGRYDAQPDAIKGIGSNLLLAFMLSKGSLIAIQLLYSFTIHGIQEARGKGEEGETRRISVHDSVGATR